MKKTTFLLLLASVCITAHAQTKTVYDTAAEKMCEYLTQHAPDKKDATSKDMEAFFSEAFLQTCMPYLDRLLEEGNLGEFNAESGQKIGYKLGLKLAVICPKYIDIMKPIVKKTVEEKGDDETGSVQCTVQEITTDGYTFLKVKDNTGVQKRLLWLMNFNGAENLNNNPRNLVGKKVTIEWKYVEIFYTKSNSFGKEKMITSVKTD